MNGKPGRGTLAFFWVTIGLYALGWLLASLPNLLGFLNPTFVVDMSGVAVLGVVVAICFVAAAVCSVVVAHKIIGMLMYLVRRQR